MSPLLKNILRIIFYGIVFFIIDYFLESANAIRQIQFSYSYPVMVFISVVFGPYVGGFGIALGLLLKQIGEHSLDILYIFCSFLNCFSIGYYMRYLDIQNGFFERSDMAKFNMYQLASNFVCWNLIYAVLSHFIYHTNLWEVLQKGFWQALGNFLSNLVAASIFLALYARSRVSAANFYRN